MQELSAYVEIKVKGEAGNAGSVHLLAAPGSLVGSFQLSKST